MKNQLFLKFIKPSILRRVLNKTEIMFQKVKAIPWSG
jgi:hypothetical protein